MYSRLYPVLTIENKAETDKRLSTVGDTGLWSGRSPDRNKKTKDTPLPVTEDRRMTMMNDKLEDEAILDHFTAHYPTSALSKRFFF